MKDSEDSFYRLNISTPRSSKEFIKNIEVLRSCGYGTVSSVIRLAVNHLLSPSQLSKKKIRAKLQDFVPEEVIRELMSKNEFFDIPEIEEDIPKKEKEAIPRKESNDLPLKKVLAEKELESDTKIKPLEKVEPDVSFVEKTTTETKTENKSKAKDMGGGMFGSECNY